VKSLVRGCRGESASWTSGWPDGSWGCLLGEDSAAERRQSVPPDSGQQAIHMALNLRPDKQCPVLPLPARDAVPPAKARVPLSAVGQHRVLPSTLTSRGGSVCLDDVRQRLSRASIEKSSSQQQPPLPPPLQPRHCQQQRQPPYAPSALHEAYLAGVSDRIRRYQQETSDYFNQSVPVWAAAPTERGEAAAANGGFRGRGFSRVASKLRGRQRTPAAVAAATSSARPKPSTTSTLRSQPVSRRRRNHPSASSRLGAGERQDGANAAAAFDEERRHLLRELREARGGSVARCGSCATSWKAAHAALKKKPPKASPRCGASTQRRWPGSAPSLNGLRARLTEGRAPRLTSLRRRLAAAESRECFCGTGSGASGLTPYPVTWSEEQAPEQSALLRRSGLRSGQRRPPQSQRRRFASLWPIWERRQLIDSLPQARDSMGGGGGGGDAQLAEIRTLEQRYDQLQLEKRRVETALNHVPSVGSAKYGRQSREDKFQISSGQLRLHPPSRLVGHGAARPGRHHLRLLPEAHGSLDGESAAPATKLFLTEEAVAANLGQLSLEAAARLTDESAAAAPAEQLATDEQQQQQLRLTVSSPEVARLIDLQASSAATASAAPTTAAASLLPTSSAAALPPAIAERPPAVRAAAAPPPAPPGGNDCRQLVLWQPPPQLSTLPPAGEDARDILKAVRRDKRQQQRGKQEQQASFALQPELQLQTMEAEEAGAADAAAPAPQRPV
uniref:PEHE domain-containing protein n=1 Tax=Macrostomum lignano TaxID=282301 RepID=A0A1I8F7V9_9PLAT